MIMIRVAAAVIERDGKVLIAKRKGKQLNGGKWEFPGGKIEYGETPQDCLVREIYEELSIGITIGEYITTSNYKYPDKSIELVSYFAQWKCGTITLRDHDEVAWVFPEQLIEYDFSEADIPVIQKLMINIKNV
jgi:8-oxo-dGTP diphosphatase